MKDGAANMAKMANSSMSFRLVCRDEKWMRCFVQFLSNCMKLVFQRCGGDHVLARVSDNFRAVKRIVEDSKRFGWNKNLSHGYHLNPDIETRSGTILLVTERFLKSASKAWTIIH